MAEEIVLVPDKSYSPQSYGSLDVVGVVTEVGAVSDDNDATYLTTSFGTISGGSGNYVRRYWGFPAPVVPGGAVIEYLRGEWRESMPPNDDRDEGLAWSQANVGIRLGSNYSLSDATVAPDQDDNIIRTHNTPNLAKDASGRPWHSFEDLASFVVATTARAKDRSSDLNDPRLYRVRLTLSYNERPVVSNLAPTTTVGTSRPVVSWDYSDPENDPQQAYRVKVFTSAQADPEDAEALYDSGRVLSSSLSHNLPLLANDTTYHFYVQVEQPQVASQTLRSTWVGASFTVSVAAPVAPGIDAFPEVELGRHRVVITEQGLPATEQYSVEHSFDGLTWQPVRGATETDFAGTGAASVSVFDYEVPLGVAPMYRARVVEVLAGGESYSSDWAVSAAIEALPSDRYWLKDLQDPSLNVSPYLRAFNLARPRPEQRSYGVGSEVAAVSHDGRRGFEGSLPFRAHSRAEYVALEALLDTGRTLLFQDPQGRQAYMSLGKADYEMLVTRPSEGETSPVGHLHDITVSAIEVARPPG